VASNDKMFIGIRSLWKVRQLTEKLKWGEDTGSIVTAQAYNFKERSYNCKKRLIARHVCLPACLSVCLSVCPSVCLSVCLSVRLSVCLSVRLPVRNNSALTGRIFMKFDIRVFLRKSIEKLGIYIKI